MDLTKFQELMRKLYFDKDKKRGVFKTFAWLVQEVGELGRALLNGNRDAIMEEMGDVLAWLSSLANILDIDLSEAAQRKYPGVCPKCGCKPCRCPENV
ncbi:MAG: MazG nucleotide pyrophosphohydrolase domain-containing protein [Candidatus Baldrarchaeia archaeon]